MNAIIRLIQFPSRALAVDIVSQSTLGGMVRGATTVFIECRRCGHKGQREVADFPLPPEARWRCSQCLNRDSATIKVWHTGGSSSARIVSFPKGKRQQRPM
jgi:hypothetical protein